MLARQGRVFREIQDSDLDAIGDLLTEGVRATAAATTGCVGLHRQGTRSAAVPTCHATDTCWSIRGRTGRLPALDLFEQDHRRRKPQPAAMFSSWYVDPEFRNYAALFASMTQERRKDVTYSNVHAGSYDVADPRWPRALCPIAAACIFSVPILSRNGARRGGRSRYSGYGHSSLACRMRISRCSSAMRNMAASSLVCRTADGALPFHFFFLVANTRWKSFPLPAIAARLLPQHRRLRHMRRRDRAPFCCGGGKPIVIV